MSDDLQNKMYHFEANPPKEVWEKIANALEADTEHLFPQRLFNYEEQPPITVWNNIEASLEEPAPAVKVIPITKFRKPLRYVAAAASIIAIVFFATIFSNKKTGAGAVIGGTEAVTTTNQSSILPLDKPTVMEDPEKNQKLSSATLPSESETTMADRPGKKPFASIRPLGLFRSISFSQHFIPERADKEDFLDLSELDNFMVYSDDDGNAMRLPKKLFSLVHCEEGDYSCKERIKQLQQKMASSASTTDFVGILEILRQLQ